MTKFEEEFNYLIELSGKVLTGKIEAEEFETHRAIFLNKYGKKQQPEIPEVPQFVAEWYEENKGSLDYMIFETCRNLTDESTDEFENWFGYDNNKAITTLVNMKNGYTVKEKRFYLKHKLTGQFLAKRNQKIEHQKYFFWTGENPLTHSIGTAWELKFTQKEIDSMGADSYEQIDVGDD
ncbi:DUF1642 domain-containing protein [Lactococcus formosensis]|uniref:DUF1642 domain-containing protein n=1 Tax=Lactococcus formosensis TaxID=1281486 RepID=A0A9X4NYF0_9LACT|nr:DUF1642 domain-containing protein [Lactococcus formosensis]MDG6115411.1 DUF1642 domain-containing protein [Lactococcus formosensis]MDG6145909.1 DUF1642 domain-containing protein [Lactococcus formosensis]